MLAIARDVVQAAAGNHAVGLGFDDARVDAPACELIVFLDEQPRLLAVAVFAAVSADERPAAFELFTVELEFEPALGVALDGGALRDQCAAVPDQTHTGG